MNHCDIEQYTDVLDYFVFISVYTHYCRVQITTIVNLINFYQLCLRGDFLDNRETGAQKYRDALRKNHEFCCFFGTWQRLSIVLDFWLIDLMKTRSLFHVRLGIVSSIQFSPMEVGGTLSHHF